MSTRDVDGFLGTNFEVLFVLAEKRARKGFFRERTNRVPIDHIVELLKVLRVVLFTADEHGHFWRSICVFAALQLDEINEKGAKKDLPLLRR